MITENLSTLKIHKLTQEQYDRALEVGNIDPNALYLTPDDDKKIFIQDEEPTDVENGDLWVDLVNNGTVSGGGSSGGANVIIQPNEPVGAGNGTLWWDTDDESGVNVDLTEYATKTYVDDAIANIDIPEVDLTEYAMEEINVDAIDFMFQKYS